VDYTPIVGTSAAVGLLIAVGALLVQLFRTNTQLTRERDTTIKSLKDDNFLIKADHAQCTRRLNLVIRTLQQHNIEVPSEVWDVPVAPPNPA